VGIAGGDPMKRAIMAALLVCLAPACSDGTGSEDAGTDGMDTVTDADASVDTTADPDAIVDPGPDGVTDAVTDGDVDPDTEPPLGCASGHFGAAATWTLSTDFDPYFFVSAFGQQACGDGIFAWYSFDDLTGDGLRDMVATLDECTGSGVGDDDWRVYASGPSGMGTATSFSIPDLPVVLERSDMLESCDPGTGLEFSSWKSMDLDGDGWLDLVSLRDPCYGTHGDGTWLVYRGSASGFAAAESWAIPVPGTDCTLPYSYFTGAASCLADSYHSFGWATVDLTYDGIADLVVQRSCSDYDVGVDEWLVYAGTGSGFSSSPTSMSLPAAPSPLSGWFTPVGLDTNEDWELMDLDGDGYLDLVVTAEGDDWTIFRGGSGGFATTGTAWPNALVVPTCGYGDQFLWHLLDMTDDGRPDIVIVRDDCSNPDVGHAYWLVHRNDGTRFTDAIEWTLPAPPGYGGAWMALEKTAACGWDTQIRWSTFDVTGDAIPDLILNMDECGSDDGLGSDHWTIYPGICD